MDHTPSRREELMAKVLNNELTPLDLIDKIVALEEKEGIQTALQKEILKMSVVPAQFFDHPPNGMNAYSHLNKKPLISIHPLPFEKPMDTFHIADSVFKGKGTKTEQHYTLRDEVRLEHLSRILEGADTNDYISFFVKDGAGYTPVNLSAISLRGDVDPKGVAVLVLSSVSGRQRHKKQWVQLTLDSRKTTHPNPHIVWQTKEGLCTQYQLEYHTAEVDGKTEHLIILVPTAPFIKRSVHNLNIRFWRDLFAPIKERDSVAFYINGERVYYRSHTIQNYQAKKHNVHLHFTDEMHLALDLAHPRHFIEWFKTGGHADTSGWEPVTHFSIDYDGHVYHDYTVTVDRSGDGHQTHHTFKINAVKF